MQLDHEEQELIELYRRLPLIDRQALLGQARDWDAQRKRFLGVPKDCPLPKRKTT